MGRMEEYFAQSDAPAGDSPVGRLMRRILADDPGLSYEKARELAHNQLHKSAGRKNYAITTPSQDAKRLANFRGVRESGKKPHS